MNSRIRGYIIHSGVVALLFSLVVIATGSALKFRSESPNPPSAAPGRAANILNGATTLTFGQRIAYQRAIEDVYWRHRSWPKERRDPKPSLDAVMSQAQLERKVADYLRNSQALADYWQLPITPEQLQAEMDRMAKHTKQPEMLRELFEALGSDPFVIAECLARPALLERLLTEFYAHDRRFDRESKRSQLGDAEIEVPTMAAVTANYTLPTISSPSGGCTDDTWTATSITGAPAPRSGHTAVWTGSEMIVWGGENGAGLLNTGGRYNPSTDSWIATSTTNAPDGRAAHTAVWTGSEMIVWGGFGASPFLNTGGRYNPGTDSWTATGTANAPSGRAVHTAVWTGNEMVVWGGLGEDFPFVFLNTGGKYNPSTDSWTATSITNAPAARFNHTAVWIGSKMVVWGGSDASVFFNTGGRYDPSTNSWTATSTSNAPAFRDLHTAVWTNSEMIVWGGENGAGLLNTGGRYNPSTDSWTATSTTSAPLQRIYHTAIWSGTEMIVWGGEFVIVWNTGGRYNPGTDSWTATNTSEAPLLASFTRQSGPAVK